MDVPKILVELNLSFPSLFLQKRSYRWTDRNRGPNLSSTPLLSPPENKSPRDHYTTMSGPYQSLHHKISWIIGDPSLGQNASLWIRTCYPAFCHTEACICPGYHGSLHKDPSLAMFVLNQSLLIPRSSSNPSIEEYNAFFLFFFSIFFFFG